MYFIFYPIIATMVRVAACALGRLQTHGRDNVPSTGGLIYCANHQSDADPALLLVTIPRKAWFIGKSELFTNPLLGWFFRQMRGFPIRRDSPDRAALRRAEEILKRGDPILLFPEGRLSQDGILQPMLPGAAMLALRARVPIVPIAIRNSRQILPYGKLVPRRSKDVVAVEFGSPILPEEFDPLAKGARVDAMTERVGVEIARLVGQEPPAKYTNAYKSDV
jgi:1-acyl-sn-glycerol-3-phosphate acyltransferase